MNGHRSDELVGDFDEYGMPSIPSAQRSSGLMGRLRKAQSKQQVGAGDDDDDEGVDPGQGFPGMSMRELSGLSDRHRYPTMDRNSRTMSMASNGTYDTTPIIPMLGSGGVGAGVNAKKNANIQYRQRMIDQRKQLLASDTGLPMPGAPGAMGAGPGGPGGGRTMSNLSHDPFQGFSNRAMSMSSQRGSRVTSMTRNNMSSPAVQHHPVFNASGPPPNNGLRRSQIDSSHEEVLRLRELLDRERKQSNQLRDDHERLIENFDRIKDSQLQQQQQLQRASIPRKSIQPEDIYNHASFRDLSASHDQLDSDYRTLESQHNDLAVKHRDLDSQHRTLELSHGQLQEQYQTIQERYGDLLQQQRDNNNNNNNDNGDTIDTAQYKELDSAYQSLCTDYDALDESHQQLSRAYNQLQNGHKNLETSHNELKDVHGELQTSLLGIQASHSSLDASHRELQTKYAALEASKAQEPTVMQDPGLLESYQDLQERYNQLQENYADLETHHKELTVQRRDLEQALSVPSAPAESESLAELRKANEQLTSEIHVLSIELAESARRELQLPTSVKPNNTAAQLARVETELARERTRRLQAEKHLHTPIEPSDLTRSHAEATQLLDMRNQEYDMLQTRLADAISSQELADSAASELEQRQLHDQHQVNPTPGSPSTDLDVQYRQLSQHTNFVEQENMRLQQMLDEVSDRGPLADRLKSMEDQRDVLQEALRTLRERKDHEIRLLLDRARQLETRIERPRLTSNSSSHVYSASSVSSDNSQENAELSFGADDKPLEPPRMRSAPRPASPLHINFNMDLYSDQRGRTDQRTSPLPLALGN